VRRERLDTSGLDQTLRRRGRRRHVRPGPGLSGAADRATNSGPLDRLADKATT
jgi:hypothetical protein